MTVREMIARLQAMPQACEVEVMYADRYVAVATDVRVVDPIKGYDVFVLIDVAAK